MKCNNESRRAAGRKKWVASLSACLVTGSLLGPVAVSSAVAQQPSPSAVTSPVTASEVVTIEQLPAGVEVLMRGPVHQAFAQPYPADEPMMRVDRPVPAPLRERPAAARPSDPERTAQWIPGYWALDPESDDFLWVSGVWRFPPPGMQWVPGYWHAQGASSTWVSGFWVDQQIEELEFVSQPPAPRQRVPAEQPPSDNHFWVPGYWVNDRGEFVWEPGTWAEAQPGWVWEPTRYLQTPSGWVFVDGYWDFEPTDRGLLFAPLSFERATVQVTREVRRPVILEQTYWPQVAIQPRHAMVHWFTQPAYTHYYFGNYYDASFARRGIVPWVGYQQQATVYDPLFWYYRAAQPTILNQLVQSRSRVIAQPTLQPATVFGTEIAATQLPDYVQTVDTLLQGEAASGYTRVEADVLDQYSEQLRQYDAFTDERLTLRAQLGDEAAAQVQAQQRQQSETTTGDRESQNERDSQARQQSEDPQQPGERRSGEIRGEIRERMQERSADRREQRDQQRLRPEAATTLPEPRDEPTRTQPNEPPRRADAPATDDRAANPLRPPAAPQQQRSEQQRGEAAERAGTAESRRADRPGAPADPRGETNARGDANARGRADLRGEAGSRARLETRGEAGAAAGGDLRSRSQSDVSPPTATRQPLQSSQQQPRETAPGSSPAQRLNLNRLRQIQMPEGLPRAQGVPEGQQRQFAPPQRLGRPGLLRGRGDGARQGTPSEGASRGRPGILQRLGR